MWRLLKFYIWEFAFLHHLIDFSTYTVLGWTVYILRKHKWSAISIGTARFLCCHYFDSCTLFNCVEFELCIDWLHLKSQILTDFSSWRLEVLVSVTHFIKKCPLTHGLNVTKTISSNSNIKCPGDEVSRNDLHNHTKNVIIGMTTNIIGLSYNKVRTIGMMRIVS